MALDLCCARSDRARIWPFGSGVNSREASGHVGNHHWNHEGATAARSPIEVNFLLVFHHLNAANARTDHDADLFSIKVGNFKFGIGKGLLTACYGKMGKPSRTLHVPYDPYSQAGQSL